LRSSHRYPRSEALRGYKLPNCPHSAQNINEQFPSSRQFEAGTADGAAELLLPEREKILSNRFPEQRLNLLAEVVLQAFGAVVSDVHQAHSAVAVNQNQRREALES
jgi:hypothetical protein